MVAFGKFRPDDPRTEGLVHTSRQDTLDILHQLFDNWVPAHQAFLINHGPKLAALAASIPGFFFTFKMRRLFGLHKLAGYGSLVTGIPPCVVPASLVYGFHQKLITDDILLEETDCVVCVDVRSSILQLSLGSIFPIVTSFIGSAVTANANNMRIVPSTARGWMILSRAIFNKITPHIAAVTLFQLIVSGVLVRQQYNCRYSVMAELETRFMLEQQESEERRNRMV